MLNFTSVTNEDQSPLDYPSQDFSPERSLGMIQQLCCQP